MPPRKSLTTATLLVLLGTCAVSCGGDGEGGTASAGTGLPGAGQGPGSDGDGTTAVAGLAEVPDIQGLVRLVNSATLCEGVSQTTQDTALGIDGGGVVDSARIAATNKAWSIKARAICRGESWADNVHELLLIDDMTTFQSNYKAYQRSKGDTVTRWYVGRNFAVKLNADTRDLESLVRAGTLGLNCSPNFVPPAGFRNEKASVDGCLLTDAVD